MSRKRMVLSRVLANVAGRVVLGVFALASVSSVFAQEADTAYVPFIVNVDATVKAEEGASVISMQVTANTADTLKIPLYSTSAAQRPRNARNGVPVITSNRRGKVLLNLPVQSYGMAEISLYSVNGKRVLHGTAAALQTARNISHPNLVAGVYLLSVKSANGHSFSSRLTHQSGGLDINVVFGNENATAYPALPSSGLSKQAAANSSGGWTLTVSAVGYIDSSYTMDIVQGMNDVQNITLRIDKAMELCGDNLYSPSDQFCDERDHTIYRYATIGSQTWMAENLNWAGEDGNLGLCYNNVPDSCAKYGRLYDWATIMMFDSDCNSSLCADQIQDKHQGICPHGWHVPSDAEWETLVDYAGGESIAGMKLKAASGWNAHATHGDGTDDFGFSAMPGGYGYPGGGGGFGLVGDWGNWWGATEGTAIGAYYRTMYWSNAYVEWNWYYKTLQFSARCLQD